MTRTEFIVSTSQIVFSNSLTGKLSCDRYITKELEREFETLADNAVKASILLAKRLDNLLEKEPI
jgi:hypothetical protein